ncbi:MAG: PEP-utilizing enzyme [Patescibacteria group bacterium]|nr:PEP-utilizing enzyme [Patescibacteria group bacterium]
MRIIRLIEESSKFKEGEVLVASMTDPKYISVMKRAAVFVTDEGGITCHATIVSRELKNFALSELKSLRKYCAMGKSWKYMRIKEWLKLLNKRRLSASDEGI